MKRVKRSATLSYDTKSLRLARRRAKEKTDAFREIYRFRAGAEGTMSDLSHHQHQALAGQANASSPVGSGLESDGIEYPARNDVQKWPKTEGTPRNGGKSVPK